MDRVIYRDYMVNRRFFIYCSLATWPVSLSFVRASKAEQSVLAFNVPVFWDVRSSDQSLMRDVIIPVIFPTACSSNGPFGSHLQDTVFSIASCSESFRIRAWRVHIRAWRVHIRFWTCSVSCESLA